MNAQSPIVERVTIYTDELLSTIQLLMSQVSSWQTPISKEYLQKILTEKSVYIFIVRDGDGIVGTATLVVAPVPSKVIGWVEDVVVNQHARGKGYGEALMVELINTAKKLEVDQLKLTSNEKRVAAHNLYKKMKFEILDTRVFELDLSKSTN